MEQFIGCDAHKKFSVFVAVNEKGQAGEALRVMHDRQVYREFLARLPPHSSIAVEASGSYSWLVDEMERSGHRPKLCNPLEAKRRMGLTKKTEAILLRNGTLPEVWIPPSELGDQRELLRLRIFLVHLRTRVKNRIQGTLARHNVQVPGAASLTLVTIAPSAIRAVLFGRNPKEQGRKSASNKGSITSFTAICTTRSFTVGMPNGRVFPGCPGFGI